ncbi:MAG: hypothetical protein D6796_11425, partial [Caldilineae bacterium]
THYPFRKIVSGLTEPLSDHLYLLDNTGLLRLLRLADHTPITQTQTDYNTLRLSINGAGELSFDPARRRLYIGGDPALALDADSLALVARLPISGSISPDPAAGRLFVTPPCSCRFKTCNTFLLDAETFTPTATLFSPQDPFTAPCPVATSLDAEHRLLYVHLYNGVPGSNSGNYFTVFDVTAAPEPIFTAWDISYGRPAFDVETGRAFFIRYRVSQGFLERFDLLPGRTLTRTLELAGGYGSLAFDPARRRLYAVDSLGNTLQVFDDDLALLSEIPLPAGYDLLTFDPVGGRLYLAGEGGKVLVVGVTGGQPELPPPPPPSQFASEVSLLVTAPGGDLFRVFGERLQRSTDGGQTWQAVGAGLPARSIFALAPSPDYRRDRTLFAAPAFYGSGGGLYRSTDGGDTWRPVTRGLTDLSVSQIIVSPTFARDRTLFAITSNHGLFRSTDGGDTWQSLAAAYAGNTGSVQVASLALSPTFADDHLLLLGYSTLYRSTDGGETWQNLGLPAEPIAFSPTYTRDHLLFAGGTWRSTDGGETWEPAAAGRIVGAAGLAQNLQFSPAFATDRTMYLLADIGLELPPLLQRSTDAGRTWQTLLGGLPDGFTLRTFALLPDGRLYLTGAEGKTVTRSPDALDWGTPPADLTALDLQALAIAPDGTLFVANSGAGVFRSTDGGRTWAETGFPARSESFDNALLSTGGDGTLFAAVGTALLRSDDGGASWTYLSGFPAGVEMTALAASPTFGEDGVVLVGSSYHAPRLYRSADRGETWEVVFDGTSVEDSTDLSLIAFSPRFAEDGTVYAWLQYGGLLRSTDGGRTWAVALSDADVHVYGQSLLVMPDGDVVMGALQKNVLRWREGESAWQNIGEGIPDYPTWGTALALAPDGSLLLGTDLGVYRTSDGGQTWVWSGAGLPPPPEGRNPPGVRALATAGGRVYATLTWGGVFVSEDGGQTWRSTLGE